MTNFIQVKELGAISNAESEVIRKDGSVLPVLVSAMAEKDASGRFSRSRATVIDNTERKEAEAQIYKLNAELAARAQKLEMINKELESFSYTVSHDLKTPLRGINGYSHLLLEDYADRIDEEGRFFLQNIRKASSQMGRLIDDLLTYSRLERRPLNPTAVELQLFVDGLLAQYADEAQARHVALTVSLPNTILQVDPDGLGVALRNVIDNAFKYTQHVISPAVEIGGEETDHTCLVWVKDNGIGFDMRYHDRIFEIFQRLGQDEDYPGTGVGLALVRKAIQRMGGKVWADSKPGEGAIFFLEIPK